MWDWLATNNGSIAVVVSIITAALALFHYLSIKRSEERGRRFANYHQLIDELNHDGNGKAPCVDRQIAIVFELRNFPEYYPVTLRILKRSLHRWRELKQDTKLASIFPFSNVSVNTLADEARLSIKFIEDNLKVRRYFFLTSNPDD